LEASEILKWLKALGFEMAMFLAGLAGAWVSTNRNKHLTTLERVSAVFSGGFIANYVTPIFTSILNFSESTMYGMAFIVGYIGMKSVEYIIDYIHEKFEKNEPRAKD
jgi:uncharacterized membrane protein